MPPASDSLCRYDCLNTLIKRILTDNLTSPYLLLNVIISMHSFRRKHKSLFVKKFVKHAKSISIGIMQGAKKGLQHFGVLFVSSSYINYFSYKNFSGSSTLKSTAKSRKSCGVMVCNLSGLIESIFTRISADFSTVCISPKVKSKSSPAANIP